MARGKIITTWAFLFWIFLTRNDLNTEQVIAIVERQHIWCIFTEVYDFDRFRPRENQNHR